MACVGACGGSRADIAAVASEAVVAYRRRFDGEPTTLERRDAIDGEELCGLTVKRNQHVTPGCVLACGPHGDDEEDEPEAGQLGLFGAL